MKWCDDRGKTEGETCVGNGTCETRDCSEV